MAKKRSTTKALAEYGRRLEMPCEAPRQPAERPRYLMDSAIVTAERSDENTWRVYGPWPEPFNVDDETFRKRFSDL